MDRRKFKYKYVKHDIMLDIKTNEKRYIDPAKQR